MKNVLDTDFIHHNSVRLCVSHFKSNRTIYRSNISISYNLLLHIVVRMKLVILYMRAMHFSMQPTNQQKHRCTIMFQMRLSFISLCLMQKFKIINWRLKFHTIRKDNCCQRLVYQFIIAFYLEAGLLSAFCNARCCSKMKMKKNVTNWKRLLSAFGVSYTQTHSHRASYNE